jgi:hypothetical protein
MSAVDVTVARMNKAASGAIRNAVRRLYHFVFFNFTYTGKKSAAFPELISTQLTKRVNFSLLIRNFSQAAQKFEKYK